jgi:hypothetical protein
LVVIEGYKHTPPEFSEEEGCRLNMDFRAVVAVEKDSVNSDLNGSTIRPTACMNY